MTLKVCLRFNLYLNNEHIHYKHKNSVKNRYKILKYQAHIQIFKQTKIQTYLIYRVTTLLEYLTSSKTIVNYCENYENDVDGSQGYEQVVKRILYPLIKCHCKVKTTLIKKFEDNKSQIQKKIKDVGLLFKQNYESC